jgi:hypothetical protein
MKLGILLLTVLLSCNSSKNMSTSMDKKCEYIQVPLVTLVEDQIGGYVKEEIRVISDRKSLLEVYGYVNRIRKPGFSIPKIDFSKETVIAIFMGEKTSGGYAITVESVKEVNERVVVQIKETKPDPKDMVTMVITQPFCFVMINSVGKEFVFEKKQTKKGKKN